MTVDYTHIDAIICRRKQGNKVGMIDSYIYSPTLHIFNMRGHVRWGCISLFIAVLLCIRFLVCFSLVLTTQCFCMTALHIRDGSIHFFYYYF